LKRQWGSTQRACMMLSSPCSTLGSLVE
jgi:hypothetical protein